MKKLVKSLILTLLVAAMMLNTCGIVLADTTATISVTQEVEDETAGIYKLVFKLTSNAAATALRIRGRPAITTRKSAPIRVTLFRIFLM